MLNQNNPMVVYVCFTTVVDWDDPITFITLTSDRMLQMCGRMLQTSGRIFQTSGRVFRKSGLENYHQLSNGSRFYNMCMLKTWGRMFQTSCLLFRMFCDLLGIPYLRGKLTLLWAFERKRLSHASIPYFLVMFTLCIWVYIMSNRIHYLCNR